MTSRRDYPWSGIAVVTLGAVTLTGDLGILIYGVANGYADIVWLAAILGALLLGVVVSGVRGEWPR